METIISREVLLLAAAVCNVDCCRHLANWQKNDKNDKCYTQ